MKKTVKENPALKRLQDIEKEIAEQASLRDELKAHWVLEKELINEIREMKGEIETLKLEADTLERKGELGRVAEIRYGKLIELEKKLNDLATQSGRAAGELVQDAVAGYVDDLAGTRDMLDSRYDDLKNGKVKLIPGEEVFARLNEKSKARRLKPGS